MKQYRELLALTEACLDSAKRGELLTLSRLMETRSLLIDRIQTFGELGSLPKGTQKDVFDSVKRILEMDKEIARVIKLEMSHNRHSLASLLSTRKVLSAYKDGIPKVISFDKVK